MSEAERKAGEIRQLLDELHEALGEADSVAASLEEPLRGALGDVQSALDRAEEAGRAQEPPPLAKRVEDLALEFELAHPRIAGILNRLTHQLASLGI